MLKIVVVAEEKCEETCRICTGHVRRDIGSRAAPKPTQHPITLN